jgi:hypothetical protein
MKVGLAIESARLQLHKKLVGKTLSLGPPSPLERDVEIVFNEACRLRGRGIILSMKLYHVKQFSSSSPESFELNRKEKISRYSMVQDNKIRIE